MGRATLWGSTITVEVSSASPADDPVWVDISDYVRPARAPVDAASGRQTELPDAQPGTGMLVLEDRDGRFVVGNSSSPYYPWWKPGCQVRVRETIGARTFGVVDGYVEMAQTITSTQVVGDESESDSTCAVVLVDLLGHLQSAPAFVSTLAAHIIGSDRGSLTGYWPLGDATEPFENVADPSVPARTYLLTGTTRPDSGMPQVLPQQGTALPGDDLSPLRLVPATASGLAAYSTQVYASYSGSALSVAAGQVVTAVSWVNLDLTSDDDISALAMETGDGQITLTRYATTSGTAPGLWRLSKPVGTLTGAVNSTLDVGGFRPYLLGIRFGFTPNVLELWVDDAVYTATLSGTLVGPTTLTSLWFGSGFLGSASHMQLYLGADTDFTHADFLAQREVGLLGLERQTTGERIRTVAGYAGIPTSQLGRVDDGVAVMSAARLAGQTPLEAMRDAETTEQGRLLSAGTGDLVFHARTRRYDI